jgi:aspartyl-tRNA(Asn)/glutamyl-tRNA(Gln) amidotransferase subunit C
MAITQQDVTRIARLACIELSEADSQRAQQELTGIMRLIQQIQSIDTQGIEPMAHPLEARQDIRLRLRPDVADPTNTVEQRDQLMANSPAEKDGLFLVPTVIE